MVSNADIGFVAWGGRYMARSRRRLKAFILSAPLLLAACGGQAGSQPAASSTPSASGAMTAKFLSPSSGTVVTGNAIDLKVQVSGYRLSCAQAGKPNKEGGRPLPYRARPCSGQHVLHRIDPDQHAECRPWLAYPDPP